MTVRVGGGPRDRRRVRARPPEVNVKRTLLSVTPLEDRAVPATYGVPWHDPRHLTLSFVPDGTPIAGHVSGLEAALDGQNLPEDWRRTILTAFQTWTVHTNLNFGWREDAGLAFGTPGFAQQDPRFGDVRVGGHAMSPAALAVALPPDPTLSGTWSGDVFFNTDYTFDGTPYSLLAVALHEAGHALGLANSPSANDVMYTTYTTTRTALSANDVARIKSLYGTRAKDDYEGSLNNNVRARASRMREPAAYTGETPLVAFGDLRTAADVDFYKFVLPTDGNNDDRDDRTVTVRLQSTGASLLAPKVTVYNPSGAVLGTLDSDRLTGDTLQVPLTNLLEGGTYFVRVEAATSDVFGVGRYGLSVRFDDTSSVSDEVIGTLLGGPYDLLGPAQVDAFFRTNGDVLLNAEEGANETPGTATRLTSRPGYAANRRFEGIASLAKKEDVDVYRVVAPSGAARALTATVWTADETGFRPEVRVVTGTGQPVPATVLVNGNGTSTVQVPDTVAGRAYFIRVTAAPDAGQDKGNYFVGATFGAVKSALTTFAEGSLSDADRDATTTLYVGQTQLFHFLLTAGPGDPGARIRAVVRTAAGEEVHRLEARSGSADSGSSVVLTPGAYTVRFEIDNPNGPAVAFKLAGSSESDPMGPVKGDATLAPKYQLPLAPGTPTPPQFGYPPGDVSYDPSTLPGYVDPNDPTTYPPGVVLPPEYLDYPWFLATPDPYYWLALGY
jgi:hypothetical protein